MREEYQNRNKTDMAHMFMNVSFNKDGVYQKT